VAIAPAAQRPEATADRIAVVLGARQSITTIPLGAGLADALLAGIADGTRVTVLAGSVVGNEGVVATGLRGAEIQRTCVVVVAVDLVADASTVKASIARGTRILVVTDTLVRHARATLFRIADLVCTGVPVVLTNSRISGHAQTPLALVPNGTGIPVVARQVIGPEHAPPHGIAVVGGADVAVIAFRGRPGSAVAGNTKVTCCTGVPVLAGYVVEVIQAAPHRIAPVVGTDVPVVAVAETLGQTTPVHATIALGADVPVVAFAVVLLENTANQGVAAVVGTLVGIGAQHRKVEARSGYRVAKVDGAGISIIAVRSRVDTSDVRVAGIHGARVLVVAILGRVATPRNRLAVVPGAGIAVTAVQWLPAVTPAPGTQVPDRAGVTIVAGFGIRNVDAPRYRVARIVRAWIVVITDPAPLAGPAQPPLAEIPIGADIPVVAGSFDRIERATGCRVADIGGAGVVIMACHGCPGTDSSIQAAEVDGTGTAVVAVIIGQAVPATRDRRGLAKAGLGLAVVLGARVPVVALQGARDARRLDAFIHSPQDHAVNRDARTAVAVVVRRTCGLADADELALAVLSATVLGARVFVVARVRSAPDIRCILGIGDIPGVRRIVPRHILGVQRNVSGKVGECVRWDVNGGVGRRVSPCVGRYIRNPVIRCAPVVGIDGNRARAVAGNEGIDCGCRGTATCPYHGAHESDD
jgi:hypothetical protein